MLTAEIIAIGSELLTPDKTDTNSLWLTGKLNEIGIEVKLKTVVGDDALRLEETIREAVKRSDIVISTGGLGPTEDDITRRITARAIGRELVYHDDIEKDLIERFKKWGREMPEINKRQAFVIEGAEILPNPNGSAVGMAATVGEKIFVILPGPPRENQPMFTDFILPKLRSMAGEIYVKRRTLRVSGIGESAVDEAIAPIYKSYPKVDTSILFNKSEIEVQLSAKSESETQAEATLNELSAKIVEQLGIAVFALHGEQLEEIVGKLLRENKKTVAFAESCTGGLVSQRITDVPGASAYFIESFVAYANEAKVKTLNVAPEIIGQHGAVSAEVAEAMAEGMREKAGTDFAVSVTGIAGPEGGTAEKPVGLVFVGYADEFQTKSLKVIIPGDRFLIRWRASQTALDYLRRQILKTQNQPEKSSAGE